MRWFRRLWRSFVGYSDCPCCGEQALRWHKYVLHHEDEPPMFGWWHCEACDRSTDVLPTALIDKAAAGFGYRDFAEFAEARLASVDTRPKDEDPAQTGASLASGAVPAEERADAQTPPSESPL